MLALGLAVQAEYGSLAGAVLLDMFVQLGLLGHGGGQGRDSGAWAGTEWVCDCVSETTGQSG